MGQPLHLADTQPTELAALPSQSDPVDATHLKETHEDVPPDFYDTLKTNPFQRIWHGRRFERIAALVSPTTGRILDVGCDGGTLTERVATKAGASEVVGIDISDRAVAYTKKKRPQFQLAVGDAEALPFREASFDAIFCSEVLEHVAHPQKLLAEIRRCLKADGYAVVVVPTETPLFKFIWFFWTRFGKGKVWEHAHVQEFSGDSLDRLAKETGFRLAKDSRFLLGMVRAVKMSPA